MATYGFLKEFVPAVLCGKKTQTVRKMRKKPPRVGSELVLKCSRRRIGTATITEVFPIRFYAGETALVMVRGKVLSKRAESALARRDGLDAVEFKKFLRKFSRAKNAWNEFLVIRWKGFQEA